MEDHFKSMIDNVPPRRFRLNQEKYVGFSEFRVLHHQLHQYRSELLILNFGLGPHFRGDDKQKFSVK